MHGFFVIQVILRAIADSASALSYIIALLFLFFFHFGVAGVFLFAENDPYYFGDIGKAFVTLFQVSTLDEWSPIAKTNMYGCDLYGYQTGEDYFDDKCEHPNGLGWIAAVYFFLFIIFGTMVLLSLFIGIIIASMELIKMRIKDESIIWKKVSEVQAKRGYISSSTISNLLEVFDAIDVGANGVLSIVELKPLLDLVSSQQSVQYEIFMAVDQDYSGRVDFAEFLEFVHHLGIAYKNEHGYVVRPTPAAPSRKGRQWSFRGLIRTHSVADGSIGSMASDDSKDCDRNKSTEKVKRNYNGKNAKIHNANESSNQKNPSTDFNKQKKSVDKRSYSKQQSFPHDGKYNDDFIGGVETDIEKYDEKECNVELDIIEDVHHRVDVPSSTSSDIESGDIFPSNHDARNDFDSSNSEYPKTHRVLEHGSGSESSRISPDHDDNAQNTKTDQNEKIAECSIPPTDNLESSEQTSWTCEHISRHEIAPNMTLVLDVREGESASRYAAFISNRIEVGAEVEARCGGSQVS